MPRKRTRPPESDVVDHDLTHEAAPHGEEASHGGGGADDALGL